jgi:phosphoribosylaminoimidazole-succinocarboxamide synthase
MAAFEFPGQTAFYSGKVRDVYTINNKWLVMIASDRISAFDVILPKPIPFKGQVLNKIAAYMLEATRDICPNWLLDVPAPNGPLEKNVIRSNRNGCSWKSHRSCLENLFIRQ